MIRKVGGRVALELQEPMISRDSLKMSGFAYFIYIGISAGLNDVSAYKSRIVSSSTVVSSMTFFS
jgi:hypothetical protein